MLKQPTIADFNHGDDDAVVGGTTKLFNVEEDFKKLMTFEINQIHNEMKKYEVRKPFVL